MRSKLFCLTLTCLLALVAGWTKEDHEIFRLRDEIEVSEGPDVDFYQFLGTKSSASQTEILKSYRRTSLKNHPDKAEHNFIAQRAKAKSKDGKPKVNRKPSQREIKNAVKEAQVKFARLSVVKGILTGEGRARYDHFLKNGFPKWRSTGYYYNRYRPGLGVTLLGLWLFTGGAVHYGILVLGYKQNRKFVERTIKRARKAAFGDESAAAGIPGIDSVGEAVSASDAMPQQEEPDEQMPEPRNRKERRAMEKAAAKEGKASKGPVSQKKAAAKAVADAPPVPKKRVMAENGKVLLVAQNGEVWIEEEDNDGNTEEYLLDPDDLEKPTLKQTALFRAPAWAFKLIKKKVSGKVTEEEEEEIEELSPDNAAEEIKDAVEGANGKALNASKKKSKKRA